MSRRIKKASNRYTLEMLLAMTLYVVVLFGAKFAEDHVGGAARVALALAPILPLILAALAFFRFFFNMDERDRRIVADAAALTLLIGIFAAITLGFLRSFGVFSFEDDMIWFGPLLIALWGVVRFILGGRDC